MTLSLYMYTYTHMYMISRARKHWTRAPLLQPRSAVGVESLGAIGCIGSGLDLSS